MKIVKNACYGGFSLSPKGISRYAELKGKTAYFFKTDYKNKDDRYIPVTLEEAEKIGLFFFVYTVPNPQDYKLSVPDADGLYLSANKRAKEITIDIKREDRTDPDLIHVVEELGDKANGRCANIEVVEILDGIKWEIDEYDGYETIREKHRSW